MARLFMLFAYLLAVASADQNDSTLQICQPKLNENFAYLVKRSFPTSTCCNVLFTGASGTNKNLFTTFVNIYPRSYTINAVTPQCSGYVIVSDPSAKKLKTLMKSLPTALPSSEMLIFFDKDVDESSEILKVPMYEKASVSIGAPNGLWKLRKNSSGSPIFKKLSSYSPCEPKSKSEPSIKAS